MYIKYNLYLLFFLLFILTFNIFPVKHKVYCYYNLDEKDKTSLLEDCEKFSIPKHETTNSYILNKFTIQGIKSDKGHNIEATCVISASKKNDARITIFFETENFPEEKNMYSYFGEIKREIKKYFQKKDNFGDLKRYNDNSNRTTFTLGKIEKIIKYNFYYSLPDKEISDDNLNNIINDLKGKFAKDEWHTKSYPKIILLEYIKWIEKKLGTDDWVFDINYKTSEYTQSIKFSLKLKEDKPNEILIKKYFKKIYTAKFYIPENMIRDEKQITEDEFKKLKETNLEFYDKMDSIQMEDRIIKELNKTLKDYEIPDYYKVKLFYKDDNKIKTVGFNDQVPKGEILFNIKNYLINKSKKNERDLYEKNIADTEAEIINAIESNYENDDIESVFTTFNDYKKKLIDFSKSEFANSKIRNKIDELTNKIDNLLKGKDFNNLKKIMTKEIESFIKDLDSATTSTIAEKLKNHYLEESALDRNIDNILINRYIFNIYSENNKIDHDSEEKKNLTEYIDENCQTKELIKKMKDVKENLRLNIKLSANETKRNVVNDFFNELQERFMNLCRNVTYTYLFRELCELCDTNNDTDSLIFTIMKDEEDVTASEEVIPYGANLTIKFKSCNSLKKFKYFKKNRKVEELIHKEQVISKKKSKKLIPKEQAISKKKSKEESKEEVVPKKVSIEGEPKKEIIITKPREKESKEEVTKKEETKIEGSKIEETKKETKEQVISKKEVISKKGSTEEEPKKETVITKPREKKSKEKLIPKPSKNTNCCCGGCSKCCRNRSLQKT